MLLGKIKIHELAKELNKTSKEIIAIAQELGIKLLDKPIGTVVRF